MECIKTIRKISPSIPIQFYLEDTPANNFDITKYNIENGMKDSGYDNISYSYIAKSFYEPLFPDESIDIIYSNTCVH